ncbi:hypothetical protein SOVF_045280 [Spinacia oleracea]|uniref:DNA-directed RNA polymerase III subunit RPC4 n=1 Tax=Spinacia oleracea TaxID=3562 RepID=A0ABM3RA19_SPIOL|nr:uncharacterized protein LOC110803508 [Spinacia oleracea]KNA21194.1 hypothetical protein SOVF_045280 [Spinacia oleracea]
MDPASFDQKPRVPRKVRFQPKAPVRKPSKAAVAKTEVADDAEAAQKKELMRRFQDGLEAKPKFEKKTERVQRVAFGYGSSIPGTQFSASNGNNSWRQDKAHSNLRENKEYKEPWNYYSYYPVTLPLRRPYSGNPDILNDEEFGQLSTFDESTSNPAMELGLMGEAPEPRMMFLQLPTTIPMTKRNSAAAGQESTSSSKPPSGSNPPVEKAAGLKELQAGVMGKMLVYRSGAVKLKLGDTLYDVSLGSDCAFAQDVVAINAVDKHFSVVGELNKRAILTPDVDSILDSFADLG